jgi:hypothetical protein
MDRRTFNKLTGIGALSALAEGKNAALTERIAQAANTHEIGGKNVVLEDEELLVAFDALSGALTRLERKSTHWVIERRPELAISFRLHAPLPHRRYNFVLGQQQKAAWVEKVGPNKVSLEWKNLLSQHGGVLPMTFAAVMTLEKGALRFDATLVNDSPLWVETIDYPYFGDFNPPTPETRLEAKTMWYGDLPSEEIYPNFKNDKGYWGVFYPTKTFDSNRSLFCLIQALHEGLYVEMSDPTQRYLLQYTFEQHPGVVSSVDNLVPQEVVIGDHPTQLEVRTTHFVFAHPHSTVKLVPIVMRGYDGDWHAGVDLYKAWRKTWFKPPLTPAWVRDIHSWQQLQIDSPEQDYRVHYNELVEYGEECARNGVKVIQLVGWNHGGQDGGDPSQDTEPGLGTRQQLVNAIAKVQAMGVKIVLFGKLNWVDLTTPWYEEELHQYEATDPYGIPYQHGGYSYFTPTQLAGINNHRRAVMDFQCLAYRGIATREFQKLLSLGAAGWLFDENCHHGPVKYSFAPDHGYPPPAFIYGGDMPLAAQLRAAADKFDRDFLFAGEGHQQWLMQYYPLSYFRINASSTPVDRYVDPQAPLMVTVTGFDDREKLNLILLYRYIISYEPFNFKGHVTDFPLTLAYGKKIDALRRRYRAWLWEGEFRDTLGAELTANGPHRYSVFVAPSGKRAVVVINPDREKSLTTKVNLPNSGVLLLATPEQPEARPASTTVEISPRSAAVVIEQ